MHGVNDSLSVTKYRNTGSDLRPECDVVTDLSYSYF